MAVVATGEMRIDPDLGLFQKKLSAGFSAMASTAKTAFAGVAAAATGAVGFGLKIAAQNEQAAISFTTMLGSAEKAGAFLKDLKKFAATTPFEFPELQTAASSLISAGFEANKVIPIMTTLGNVTAGMGTGAEGVKRATVALQQMSAAGRITGEDLNQLRDAGIPVFDLLAGATGKSKEEVAKLAQAGKLGKAEMQALFDSLATGGKGLERFSGLMEKQSLSLTGLISTLKDTVGQSLATIAEPLVRGLKDVLPEVNSTLEDVFKSVGPVLTEVVSSMLSVLKELLPAVAPILKVVGKALSGAFKALGPALAKAAPSLQKLAEAFGKLFDALLPVLPVLLGAFIKLIPAITVLVEALAGIVKAIPPPVLAAMVGAFVVFTQLIAPIVSLASAIGAAGGVAAFLAAQFPILATVIGALLGPIGLVVAAIAGLIAIGVLVVKNWDTIKNAAATAFEAVKDAIATAFNWVKENWPLLLSILTGPIGIAVGLIVKNFDKIKAVAQGVADAIKAAFKAVFNAIASVWNNTVGKLSFKVPSWVPGIGGKGFDVPDIPTMHDGGVFQAPFGRKEGLALLQSGETVFPKGMIPISVSVIVNGQVTPEAAYAAGRAAGRGIEDEMARTELRRAARAR